MSNLGTFHFHILLYILLFKEMPVTKVTSNVLSYKNSHNITPTSNDAMKYADLHNKKNY